MTQIARHPQRPVKVAQHLASQERQVSPPVSNNVVRLERGGNPPYGPGRHLRLAPDSLRERHLVPRAKGDLGLRRVPAG